MSLPNWLQATPERCSIEVDPHAHSEATWFCASVLRSLGTLVCRGRRQSGMGDITHPEPVVARYDLVWEEDSE